MIKKAYVDTPSGQIHYYYCGPDDQIPIIFLHQNVSGGVMYLRSFEILQGRHRCIAFDLPGFGMSFDPPPFKSVSELTQYVMAAIDALGIDAFHVLGNHTGAAMAAEMGALYPERVKTCMMVGPTLLKPEEVEPFRRQFSGSAGPDPRAEYLRITWDYIFNLGGSLDIENMNTEFWSSLRAWKARGWVYQCVWDYRFDLFIEKVECPMLLLAATDDVLHCGFKNTAEAYPRAKAVELKGANFEPALDPEGFSRAVDEFLAEVSA
jgi:haloalkane dehalogenase